MKIKNVVCAPGRTGFYFDDQRAIKRGAGHDGMFYIGQPVTEGFSAVRQAGEAISVMLILEDGQVAYGDCAAVQYSGAGGRDPLFLAKDFIPIIEQYIKPCLVGQEADNFRALAARMEAIEVGGKRLHTAIRYGVSQALLDAVAKASGRMMCEVVADEYGCTVSDHLIPIFTQSGDDRYDNADKMIIKGAQVLPHALINNVETKLGAHGEKLQEYVEGMYIYIPKKEESKKKWGESTSARERLLMRNAAIYQEYQQGMPKQELAQRYYLSEKSIQRILSLQRKQEAAEKT